MKGDNFGPFSHLSQIPADDGSPASSDGGAAQHSARKKAAKELDQLYRDHGPVLSAKLRYAFGNGPPDPEDVTQDAFARLAREQDLSAIKNLRAFIWRMARNLMLSHLRKQDVRSKYDFEIEHLFFAVAGSESSPERVIEVREQLQLINKVIADMPETRRIAFLMHRVDGLNFSAIGRQLGMSPNGVIKHVSRAVFDIKTALHLPADRD